MTLHLTNSLTRRKEAFHPMRPDRVTMYVCGPTVYNYAHIGNARAAVVFDVLFRLLRQSFGHVLYARNFTDVDDKINTAAAAAGVPIGAITQRFIEAYHADMEALGVLSPTIEPRVTEHIPDIVTLIQRLVARGHAYAAEGHVLFHVPSYRDYGRLARRNYDEMIAGPRVEVAPYKRHPMDFVLWKPSSSDLPGWNSPWGRGRPGWHVECSAMIEHHLGGPIDLHGGGQDLIFPHHENEIAQGVCAHDGRPYCNVWVHNGFITVDGQKMSKSLGNVLLVRDLLGVASGETIRLALLTAHYRQPLDWTGDNLHQAQRVLDRLYGPLRGWDGPTTSGVEPYDLADVRSALEDDLNTPAAMVALFRLARRIHQKPEGQDRNRLRATLREAGSLLGILQQDPEAWFQSAHAREARDIAALVERRDAARVDRDFTTADRIRAELAGRGITVEDRAGGSVWRRAG